MSRIKQILHMQNKGDKALVNVLLDDGTEAVVYVSGDVEVFFHKGIVRAYVKKGKDHGSTQSGAITV